MDSDAVDGYIASFPDDVRPVLQAVRETIRNAAPRAAETLSYNIPAYQIDGATLVHFAGWKKHVSLYPVPDGDAAFRRRIEPYRAGKGTLQFTLGAPVPLEIVTNVVEHLLAERFRAE